MRRFEWCVIVSAVCWVSSGCAMTHDLQPHRLGHWNRGPAPSTNPFFSVSDPIPQLGESGEFPEPVSASTDSAEPSLAAQ